MRFRKRVSAAVTWTLLAAACIVGFIGCGSKDAPVEDVLGRPLAGEPDEAEAPGDAPPIPLGAPTAAPAADEEPGNL